MKTLTTLRTLIKSGLDNPFKGIHNIDLYGGADNYFVELQHRYNNYIVYSPEDFAADLARVFVSNGYKYQTLYNTTIQQYDILNNMDYSHAKTGTDNTAHTGNITDNGGGSDMLTDTRTTTETKTGGHDDVSIMTGGHSDVNTRSGSVSDQTNETVAHGKTQSTTGVNGGYTDSTTNAEAVLNGDVLKTRATSTTVHTPSDSVPTNINVTDGGTTGTQGTKTETYNNVADSRQISYNNETNSRKLTYNNEQTKTTYGGGTSRAKTANNNRTLDTNDSTRYNTTDTYIGYNARPQEAIEAERNIAVLNLMDIILSDIRKELLYYIY